MEPASPPSRRARAGRPRPARRRRSARVGRGRLDQPRPFERLTQVAPFAREHVGEHHAQTRRVEVADHLAAEHDRDRRRLLGDDDHERVGLLGDAHRGAVARAHALRQIAAQRERQDAAGLRDAAVLDDHGAVVQGRIGQEERGRAAPSRPRRRWGVPASIWSSRLVSRSSTISAPTRFCASDLRGAHDLLEHLRLLLRRDGAGRSRGPRARARAGCRAGRAR